MKSLIIALGFTGVLIASEALAQQRPTSTSDSPPLLSLRPAWVTV